jgi:hypothetical protein
VVLSSHSYCLTVVFTTFATVNVEQALKLREKLNKKIEGDSKISLNDMIVKAAAMVEAHPSIITVAMPVNTINYLPNIGKQESPGV